MPVRLRSSHIIHECQRCLRLDVGGKIGIATEPKARSRRNVVVNTDRYTSASSMVLSHYIS